MQTSAAFEGVGAWTKQLIAALVDLGAEHLCAACRRARLCEQAFCTTCAEKLLAPDTCSAVDGTPVVAPFVYRDPIRAAILRLKYEGRSELSRLLAPYIACRLRKNDCPRADAIVSVPLHAAKLIERGYNQSVLLAHHVAKAIGARALPLALRRVRPTQSQASLTREERLANVAGAFAVRNARLVRGRRVLLLDDVVTTGATARACLRALRAAGAEPIAVVALAVREPREGNLDVQDRGLRPPQRHS